MFVRELDESDWFLITPSPVETPSSGPDWGMSNQMNELRESWMAQRFGRGP